MFFFFFFFKQKTAYEMRISDWSSDVCSSDLLFIDRQLDAGEEVVRFLMARMPRSVTAARHVAAAIDRAALTARRRQITLPLARAALHELEANEAEDSIEGV